MKINLNQDFKIDRQGTQKDWPADSEIFRNYLKAGISSGYKEGLKSDDRRIWNNIENKIDEAILGNGEVELNAIEIVFIKRAFDKAVIPASEVKLFSVVENEITKLAE